MARQEEAQRSVEVAIVGLGPTGAVLANILGRAGVRAVVFDREPGPLDLPRAVHLDGEVMRVFQSIGLGDEIASVIGPSGGVRYYSASGELLMERRPPGHVGKHAWADKNMFHQPDLEATLRAGIERYPNVDVRLSHEVLSIEDTGERVLLEVREPGSADPAQWSADWVVGCDGGRSSVRQEMGAALEDLGVHDPWLVVDVQLLSDPGLEHCTVQYCDPARPTTYVKVTGDRRRWEFKILPDDDLDTLTQPESVWRLLAKWVTPGEAVLVRNSVYTFHALLAEQWRTGRLLLAGDSAHQTPPFLGQGMCAGIRDAAALGWRLASVTAGSGAVLLDGYGSERRPHARVFLETAARLGGIIQTTDPEAAAERDAQMLSGGGAIQFVDPAPPLGPGLHAGELGGTIQSQPRLSAGELLDDAAGDGFAVIARAGLVAEAGDGAGIRDLAAASGAVWLEDEALDRWLDSLGASAAVMRPDRYLVGGAEDAAGLAALLRLVRDAVATDVKSSLPTSASRRVKTEVRK